MKITIPTIGSSGDVHPYVALGSGLQAVGYEITIATHPIFETFVRSSGLGFFPVEGNPIEILKNKEAQTVMESSGLRAWVAISRLVWLLKPYVSRMCSDLWIACQSADAIIYSLSSFPFATHIAEKLNVPAIAAFYTAIYPTSAFPSLAFAKDFGRFNRFTWVMQDIMMWFLIRLVINKWREEELKLSKIPATVNYIRLWRKAQKLILMGFSPNVLPKPKDWGENINITGFWFLNNHSNWQPQSDLVDFIESGPPPIYLGFGSTIPSNPVEITDIVLNALKRTKQRSILATGWGALKPTDTPDNVFQIESVPHDWLFPQMAAVVHHGGAGTTAAGFRAGIPSAIVPFCFDHPFWGGRVAELGVGPQPIPIKKLSAEKLADAIIRVTTDDKMRTRAALLGERIRAEDGVGKAVDLIHRHLSSL